MIDPALMLLAAPVNVIGLGVALAEIELDAGLVYTKLTLGSPVSVPIDPLEDAERDSVGYGALGGVGTTVAVDWITLTVR